MTPHARTRRYAFAILPIAALLACNQHSKPQAQQDSPVAPASVVSAAPAASVAAPAAASASALQPSPSAVPQPSRSGYSTEGLGELPADCIDPAVVILAAPKKVFESETFEWRYARQVALANPQFEVVRSLGPASKPQAITFTENEHAPTKGVALVAHCKTAATCIDFAAAYRTVVPTAKPTPICGANPNIGARIHGGKTVLPKTGNIGNILPDAKDVQSQCIRLAACKAARDHAFAGDAAQGCIRNPNGVKVPCALKKSCSEVLACASE